MGEVNKIASGLNMLFAPISATLQENVSGKAGEVAGTAMSLPFTAVQKPLEVTLK